MEIPFEYKHPVSGRWFVGRDKERTRMTGLLRKGENIVMYEPPKAGKDSLIQQVLASMAASGEEFKEIRMSFLNVRSVAGLCRTFADAVAKVHPSVVLPDLTEDPDDFTIRALLELPYSLGRGSGVRQIVCIDAFQCVMLTEDGDRFCRLLMDVFRSRILADWQAACFVLYGSQVNAMKEIFEHRKLFFREVERLAFEETDVNLLAEMISRGFAISGKVVERPLLLDVCSLFHNTTYYLNFFATVCDSISKGYMTESVKNEALTGMLAVHEPFFREQMMNLTTFQVNLLRAVVDGIVRFSSAEVIKRYDLSSSANVRRLKDALCKKEILVFDSEDVPHFLDPFFEYWVTKFYFEIK